MCELIFFIHSRQTDEALLSGQILPNKRNAIMVRIGEKRILNEMMVKVNNLRQDESGKNKRKSRGDGQTSAPAKKARK